MEIRLFQAQDTEQVAQLFHDTVRTVNRQDYSQAQVAAWAPEDIHFTDWCTKCCQCLTYVADDRGTIAGFGQIQSHGYIACLYVHQDYQGQGVGKQLYLAIEGSCLFPGTQKSCKEV
jgi:putative acetyltransferase